MDEKRMGEIVLAVLKDTIARGGRLPHMHYNASMTEEEALVEVRRYVRVEGQHLFGRTRDQLEDRAKWLRSSGIKTDEYVECCRILIQELVDEIFKKKTRKRLNTAKC